MNTNEENKVIVKPDEQKQVCSSPDTEKKETPKENRPREIKAKISIEIIGEDEPTIWKYISQFFAAVCILSVVVCVITTIIIILLKHPGETIYYVQGVSALIGGSSFWLFVGSEVIKEDYFIPGGGGYL